MVTTFKQQAELDNSTLMIVDSLNLAFRWKHSGAKEFTQDFIDTVKSLAKSYKAKYVVLACDSGNSSYRKALHPGYKGARRDKQEVQSAEEEKAFEIFIKAFNDAIFEASKYFTLLRYSKCEADDIAAYIVKNYKKKFSKIKTIKLISSDKDWDLLISENVSRFSTVSRKEVSFDNWNTHYDCSIDEYISMKCLTGDTGDSIPGIQGVGPVKAKSLIDQYGSAYDVADAIPITSKYKYIQSVNQFGKDNILLNYQLMDLLTYCEEALGEENTASIDEILTKYLE